MARRRFRRRRNNQSGWRGPRFSVRPLIIVVGLLLLLALAVVYSNNEDPDATDAGNQPVRGTSNSGVSFVLPAGWSYDQVETRTRIANRPAAVGVYPPNPGDVYMTIRAPFPKSLYADETSPMVDVLNSYAPQTLGDAVTQIGGAVEATINGQPGARATMNTDTTDGFVVAFETSGVVIAVTVETAKGALGTYEDTALEVINSIRFSPPAAPPTLTPTGG